MPVRIEANSEPIPGYRLIERLGGGGFGEVWKAEAPGGLFKAIKFVFGDLQALDDGDGARATQELKALSRVKTVHHPYILSLERYDIIDGQLIIVMELADRTLWDRFRECRTQGLPGIPRGELVPYMSEAAEALDLMNQQFQLQHLDIKPQNLFLVFNHVKVADFGLVKDLGNMAAATITGGVTPVYAAPETFDGWLSRFSDQYSLAIVYQELLTGCRPFAGQTMRQLVLQHLQAEPEVAALPEVDRPIIRRALAKRPDERFPTCLDFVRALIQASASAPSELPTPPSNLAPLQVDFFSAAPIDDRESVEMTHDMRGRPPRPEPASEAAAQHQRPSGPPPRPAAIAAPLPSSRSDPQCNTTTPSPVHTPPPGAQPAQANESGYKGIVQPSLVVGLGKMGMDTLLALRQTLSQAFGHADVLPHIRLFGIDTDPDTIQAAGAGEPAASLRAHEMLLARLHRPNHYMQQRMRDGNLLTDSWLNSKLIYRLSKQQKSAGLRALGRLAFVDHFQHIAKRLELELQACVAQDTLPESAPHADLGIRSPNPRVYVVAGLGGNTGSGMFLDAAYTVRSLLRKLGCTRAEVVGLFFLPAVAQQGIRSASLAQAYAALTELQHYSTGRSAFSAVFRDANPTGAVTNINEAGPPFDRCILLPLPALTMPSSAVPETVALAGQYLYRDIATPLGKAIDAARRQVRREDVGPTPTYQTVGMYRIVWPRQRILQQLARRLSRRVVVHWTSNDASNAAESVARWAQEKWDEAGLRPDTLITRFQELCQQNLNQSPEDMIQAVLSPLGPLFTSPGGGNAGGRKDDAGKSEAAPNDLTAVVTALVGLDQLVGIPEDLRTGIGGNRAPGAIEQALADVAAKLARAFDRRMTPLIAQMIEEPSYRLAGAEEGLRQFGRIVEQALESQQALTQELNDRAASLYQRILALLEAPPSASAPAPSGVWKFGFGRKTKSPSSAGAMLLDLVRAYAKARHQSLFMRHVNQLYIGLRGRLSDQVREVGFCRQPLSELAGLLEDKPDAGSMPLAHFEKLMLPPGCASIAATVGRLDAKLTRDDLLTFDGLIQPKIRQKYRALVDVCMGPPHLVRALGPMLLQEAESYLATRFAEQDASSDGWPQAATPAEDADALVAGFDEAAPELGHANASKEVVVVAIPKTAAGQQLKCTAQQDLTGAQWLEIERGDEIVFYRERQGIELAELAQCGSIAQEAYRQACATDPTLLHSRADITAWQPAAS